MVQKNNDLINLTSKNGFTLLNRFAREGCRDFSKIDYLVSHGAGVNIAANNWFTPLFYVSELCGTEVASFLLSYGAKINQRDEERFTPLANVVAVGTPTMVQFLTK
ncbi:hypothetical protein CO153_01475 [Candidatus Pacearchaeota archaeon CG_4_9_14_3_um_filter_30_11]|nr:MAG: hypothetical protein COV77_04005 [Candidatus Pacearchaeota archaeon CG11_big_fil_rev_8_21_14_0_20_30_13]PJA71448.1 MAG: hypothetical protein CO153_01475 [Candidatus Pacearchaeota archaeon CG_4_9_14_3_um_filter_30_11]